jgi:hypothetical protein
LRLGVVLCLVWPLAGYAAGAAAPASAEDPPEARSASASLYADKTDQELTDLAAHWDELSAEERRHLLSEVKLRMVRQKKADGVIRVRTARRYGRIIRQPDGSMLRIERKVVQIREMDADDLPQSGFGIGFERRHQREEGTRTVAAGSEPGDDVERPQPADVPVAPAKRPPVVRVNAPDR